MHGTKVTNTTPVDSAKTGGQTFLCNHYAGEDPKTHKAIKKLDEKLEAILKLLQGNAPPSPNPGEKRCMRYLFHHFALQRMSLDILVTVCLPCRPFRDATCKLRLRTK